MTPGLGAVSFTHTACVTCTTAGRQWQGNHKFQLKQFEEAIRLYSKAISMADHVPSYYNNRAAAHFELRNFRAAVRDCEKAVELDPTYVKSWVRRAKALVELGDFREAAEQLARAHQLQASPDLLREHQRVLEVADKMERGVAACQAEDYAQARMVLGDLLRETNAVAVVLWAARAELGLGIVDRVLRLTLQVLRNDSSHVGAYVVRGQAMFLSGEFDSAEQVLREALRLNPDDDEAKVCFKLTRRVRKLWTDGKAAATSRRFDAAVVLYSEALELLQPPQRAPITASLHAARGEAYLRLKQFDPCLKDCAVALYGKDDCKEAWLTKANALHALGRHQEALDDLSGLMQRWGQSDAVLRHAYERADFEVRRVKRPDYYAMLGIGSISSEMEIKTAYRQKCLECHPDKFMDKSVEERAAAEERFKALGDMLEVLTDPFKRQLYDEGYDKEAIEERVARAQRAAHENRNHHHH